MYSVYLTACDVTVLADSEKQGDCGKEDIGMSDSRIIGAMACNILALSVTALIIFAVSAVIINW